MKKLTFTLKAVWFSAILLSALSVQGMERRQGTNHSRELIGNGSFYSPFTTNTEGWLSYGQYASHNSSNSTIRNQPLLNISSKKREEYKQQAMLAEKYNDNVCLLTSLPDEKLIDIFSHCLVENKEQLQSLKNSIKNFMRLSGTCKIFNRLLTFEEIGKLCKSYAQNDKNQALYDLLNSTGSLTYQSRRLSVLILVCAGANPNNANSILKII